MRPRLSQREAMALRLDCDALDSSRYPFLLLSTICALVWLWSVPRVSAPLRGQRTDYIFGLAGNAVLDALVTEIADNLRFHHAISGKAKLRTFAGSFSYWKGAPHSRD